MRYHFFVLLLVFFLSGCSIFDWLASPDTDIPSSISTNAAPSTQTWADGDSCYAEYISLGARGIAIGSQALVSKEVAIRTHHTGSESIEIRNDGDSVTILEGPYCYETRNAGSRWWYVEVDATGTRGYVDEFSRLYAAIDIFLNPMIVSETALSVQHFNVSIPSAFGRPAIPQETIQISWLVNGAETVSVIRQDTGEEIGNGEHNVIDFVVPDLSTIEFRLLAIASDGTQIEETRSLTIDCSSCQSEQGSQISISYQAFENGMMLYRNDAALIYVLAFDGRAWTFADTWQGGELDVGELPPTGLLQPQLGFGNIWLNQSGIREALGWATSPETYFMSELLVDSDHTQLNLPDGRFISISASDWQYQP